MKTEKKQYCITGGQLVPCQIIKERRFLGFLWKQYGCTYTTQIYQDGEFLYNKKSFEWIKASNVIK